MERNHTIMQFFEWHVPADGEHWKRLKELAPQLKEQGIDSVWIPRLQKVFHQRIMATAFTTYMILASLIKRNRSYKVWNQARAA